MAGSDPLNQDSDGDGIPDSIDSDPLISALAFPDADSDGIPDANDTNPNDPRGPAPSIAAQNASGNPLSNLLKDETVKFILTVSNPAGPAPTASNLTFYLNGSLETETATIAALGSPVGSTQRFLLTWAAKTTANYPTLTLQNLTLRFRDSEQATSWHKLARIDVAEWEGMIAISPVFYSTANAQGISLLVEPHVNGRSYHDSFGGSWNAASRFYRGPVSIPVKDSGNHNIVATFRIPVGIKFPLFLVRISGSAVSNVSTIEAGDYAAFPHNSTLYYNNLSSTIRYNWGGVETQVDAGSSSIQDYATTWGGSHVSIHWMRDGQWRPISETVWPLADPFTAHVCRRVTSSYHLTPDKARVVSFTDFSKLPASITPHLAGDAQVPGLPVHPLSIEKEGTPFLVASETCHHIVFRVDPAVGQLTNGVKLRLARWDSGHLPPQPGIHLYETAGGAPLPPDANGDILLSPTQNHTLFQRLVSPQGLTLLLKRASTATERHDIQIRFVSKYEPGVETTAASVNLLPVEVAPEVLAVNSDFDEGRIDPATGYAIPDCDDTDIALEAVRNHLDGKFAINERVTDEMHPGFLE